MKYGFTSDLFVCYRAIFSRKHFGVSLVFVKDSNEELGSVGGAVSQVSSRAWTEKSLVTERRYSRFFVCFWKMHQLEKVKNDISACSYRQSFNSAGHKIHSILLLFDLLSSVSLFSLLLDRILESRQMVDDFTRKCDHAKDFSVFRD